MIKQCENGHYYNSEVESCPVCEADGHTGYTRPPEVGALEMGRCEKGHVFRYYRGELPICPICAGEDTDETTVRLEDKEQDEKTVMWVDPNSRVTPDSDDPIYPTDPRGIDPLVGWLVCVEGRERGRDYRLYTGRNFIGRSGKSDVAILDDPSIAYENHASVIFEPKSVRFIALAGESQDVTVNGEKLISSRDLAEGDIIECGNTKLCFVAFCKEGRTWEG